MKLNKIWGITENIWSENNVEIHRIDIKKGGYCSKHKHEYKFNLFYIEDGQLKVDTWQESGIIDNTIIETGEQTIVEPGKFHKFFAIEDTIAYEIYWVELQKEDIIRETVGGLN